VGFDSIAPVVEMRAKSHVRDPPRIAISAISAISPLDGTAPGMNVGARSRPRGRARAPSPSQRPPRGGAPHAKLRESTPRFIATAPTWAIAEAHALSEFGELAPRWNCTRHERGRAVTPTWARAGPRYAATAPTWRTCRGPRPRRSRPLDGTAPGTHGCDHTLLDRIVRKRTTRDARTWRYLANIFIHTYNQSRRPSREHWAVSCVPQQLIQPRSQVTGRYAISADLLYRVLLHQAVFWRSALAYVCLLQWHTSKISEQVQFLNFFRALSFSLDAVLEAYARVPAIGPLITAKPRRFAIWPRFCARSSFFEQRS